MENEEHLKPQESENLLNEALENSDYNKHKSTKLYKEIEKDLNDRILKITLKIKDQHPELYKYIEEMTVTLPYKIDPEITIKNLENYYNSLSEMLEKYLLENPSNTTIDPETPVSDSEAIHLNGYQDNILGDLVMNLNNAKENLRKFIVKSSRMSKTNKRNKHK
jgi:hypothetical protein